MLAFIALVRGFDSVEDRDVPARGPLKIRRARASDKEAVLEFCRFTWQEHGDYVDKVWDHWVEDKRGFFAVASLAGEPMATAKLTVLSPGEIWLEGLRVDPSYRGMGMSHVMTRFLLAKAKKLRARTVRFATGEDNRVSKHMGRALGFRLLGHYSIMWAASDGRRRRIFAPASDPVTTLGWLRRGGTVLARTPGTARISGDLGTRSGGTRVWQEPAGAATRRTAPGKDVRRRATEEMVRIMNVSPFGRAMKGLASGGWTFFQVNEGLLTEHLESGRLFLGRLPAGWPPGGSGSAALGILLASRNRRAGRLDAKLFADTTEDALRHMVPGAKRLAHDLRLPRVRLVVPKVGKIPALAKEAGFNEEDPGFYHGVMEKRFKNRGGPGRGAADRGERAARPNGKTAAIARRRN